MKKQLGNQTFIKKGSDSLLLKRYSALLLSCLLVFTTFPNISLADDKGKYSTKDEVIYANLTPNGKTDEMYVVNSFQVTEPGDLIDYGSYEDVRNLTDLTEITIEDKNEVHFEAEDDFFYQGTIKNQALPWDISITYLLDGKKIKPNDLAGQSGQLEIQIKTSQNKKVDPVFFEYFLLQIEMTFDPLYFENIQAPEATEANEGKDKLISFNVMPEQEETLIAMADVTDFELEPIQISAVPANVGFDDPDTDELAEEMQELSDAISDINEGVADLEDGASSLSSGASELSSGSNEFLNGINELNNSSGELVSGSNEILNVFKQVNEVVGDVPEIPSNLDEELNKVPQNLRSLASGLREFSQGIGQFNKEIDQLPELTLTSEDIEALSKALKANEVDDDIIEALKQLNNNEIDQSTIDDIIKQLEDNNADEEIDEVIKQLEDSQVDENIIDTLEQLKRNQVDQGIIDTLKQLEGDQVNQGAIDDIITQLENNGIDQGAIDETINQLEMTLQAINDLQAIKDQIPGDSLSSIEDMAKELDAFANELKGAIGNISVLDELDEFKNGLTQLASQYQKFHNGLVTYTDGVDTLAKSYKELNNGTNQLADGSSELANGVSELHEGTQELTDETSDLSSEFESEINDFMDEFDFSDYEPVSYISNKNKDVGVVQFVLQTKKIELEEAEDEPVEKEEEKNIWTKFLDLFR